MPLSFKESKAKLKEIAGQYHSQYHSLKYELTEHDGGKLVPLCSIYVNGENWYHGETWEKAFAARHGALGINKPIPIETIAAQMP